MLCIVGLAIPAMRLLITSPRLRTLTIRAVASVRRSANPRANLSKGRFVALDVAEIEARITTKPELFVAGSRPINPTGAVTPP